MKTILATLTAAMSGLAFGATDPTGFIQLQASDASGETSFTSGTHWPDGVAPEAGKSYYVPAGMDLRTAGSEKTVEKFLGDVLAVSGTFHSQKGREYQTWVSDLRLLNGGVMNCTGIQNVYGKLTAEGTAQVNYMWPDGSNWLYWHANLEGDSTAVLKIGRTYRYSGYPKAPMPDAAMQYDGDWSAFAGTLDVLKNGAVAVKTDKSIAGTVKLESGSYWTFNWPYTYFNPTQVGGLDLGDGSTIDFYFYEDKCGGFTVTNSFTHGAAKIRIRNEVTSSTTGVIIPKGQLSREYELIRLTGTAASADFDLTKFILDVPITNAANVTAKLGQLPRDPHYTLITKTDGSDKVLCLKVGGIDVDDENYVHMTVDNLNYQFAGCAFNPANTLYWSNNQIPEISPENTNTYIADKKLTFCYEGYHSPMLAKYDFSNATFYLMNGMMDQATELRVKELYVTAYPNASGYPDERSYALTSYSGAGKKHHFYGKVIAVSQGLSGDQICFRVYNGNEQVLHGEVVGDCSNIIYLNSAYSSGNRGDTWIYQDLTGYHGNISLTSNHSKNGEAAKTRYYFKDELALGGEYSGTSAWKSLSWNNCWVTFEDNVLIDEATRGLYMSGNGNLVVVEGKTLSVDIPTTWYGSWTKEGAGTLKVDTKAKFYNSSKKTDAGNPTANYNALTVNGGTVQAGVTNAFDGIAFTFADGGALAIDPASTADGMSDYGLVNTRWATPFTATTTDGKIPFVFAKDYTPTADSFTAPIATVTAAAAESLATDTFKFAGSGYTATVAKRTNADTTVTYVATFTRPPLMILFK